MTDSEFLYHFILMLGKDEKPSVRDWGRIRQILARMEAQEQTAATTQKTRKEAHPATMIGK